MRIITKKPYEDAEVLELKKLEYETMRKLVGDGNIEPIYFDDIDIICWCHEEGKLLNQDVNIAISANQKLIDTIHGNVFFTNTEEGKEGLSDMQIQLLLERLNDGMCIMKPNMQIIPVLPL